MSKKHSLQEAVEKMLAECVWVEGCLVCLRNPSQMRPDIKVGGKMMKAYRAVYTLKVGCIPEGHEIHHICENKRCVLLEHLIPKLPDEHKKIHIKLQTHCIKGHPFSYRNRKGWGRCNICVRDAIARFRARKKAIKSGMTEAN